jgi:formylglycine-generating enzyme required for sulfatase activity
MSGRPTHVTLAAFYIDQFEVTNDHYVDFLEAQGNQVEAGVPWLAAEKSRISQAGEKWQITTGYADHPATGVSWYGAQAYCEWRRGRLPSEAEWEKAAAGTDGRAYPWGDQVPDQTLLNFDDNLGDTAPVGSYSHNVSPYGAYDMAGNVWEWVSDWYDDTYYAYSPAQNPPGPPKGDFKVVRGGGWHGDAADAHAANRVGSDPAGQGNDFGFRCVTGAP